MRVEVVFALPDRQVLLVPDVPEQTTVADVINLSGIARHFPECDLDALQAGIWGQPVDRDRLVKEGDRIELFRELVMDPREARRLKAGI
jgi:putative ubiquitin-RnfH superfamily antitoxin RatB of RatAB toxin-antitoxin module